MRTRIVKIGNSQGVRIPKLLLERSNLAEEVELEAEDDRIIIRPIQPQEMGGRVSELVNVDRPESRLPSPALHNFHEPVSRHGAATPEP